jgi:hypothetical protein
MIWSLEEKIIFLEFNILELMVELKKKLLILQENKLEKLIFMRRLI